MTVNSKDTIVEILAEEYRSVTQVDLKSCATIAGGHGASASAVLKPPLPSGIKLLRCHFGHTRKEEYREWAVPAAKHRAEDECFMMLTCADPEAG